jgi:flagellar protein FlaI
MAGCTIHAENVDAVEKRLLTKPMNIPPMLIPMMNVVALIGRTKRGEMVIRRVMDVSEIVGINEKTGKAVLKGMCKWDSVTDSFDFNEKTASESVIFKKISESRHVTAEALLEELQKREQVLKWMARRGMRSYDEVSKVVRSYYLSPGEVYNRTRLEM